VVVMVVIVVVGKWVVVWGDADGWPVLPDGVAAPVVP